jgi:hypothetical protein
MAHLKRLLLAATSPAQADPLSIGVAVLVNIGWAGTITAVGAWLVGAAVIGVGVLGASLVVSALSPRPPEPKPSERQATVRQAVAPRVRFYGRVKVGGTMWFFDTAGGWLYVGVTLNEGEISAVVEIWLHDKLVTLYGDDFVDDDQYKINDDTVPVAKIRTKLGTASQTVHADLDAAFPSVTSDHRLRGVANVLAEFKEVKAEYIASAYPNYIPQVRIVMDASLVKDVRTGLRGYSDNFADVIYDYLTGVDGAGFPYGAGYTESEIDLASFQAFAELCDEPVPLKAGGTVARYIAAGGYGLNEEMRDVLPRMLRACDGDLYFTAAGKIGIRGGQWVEPTLTLDDTLGHIIDATFRQGQGSLAAFNELTVVYTEPTQDYQEAEAQVWIDEANQALRGKVLSEKLEVLWAPNHSQARRLAKIHTAKSNPRWSGTVITNFYGLNVIGEQTITIKFSPLGIDETFEVVSYKFLDEFTGVELQVRSLDASAYEWDADEEEGDGPAVPPDTTDTVVTGPVADVVATPGTGIVEIAFTLPEDANVAGARVYQNTVDDFGTASRVDTVYGGPEDELTSDLVLPAGSYFFWICAINGSGLEATEVATGSVNVS